MSDNLPAPREEPPKPSLSANRALTSLTVDEMLRIAMGFARSKVFKGGGNKEASVEELFILIVTGQELGIGPSAAIQGIHMIEGKPSMSANLQAALLKASGKYDYRAEFTDMDGDNPTCTITVFSTSDGEAVGATSFSKEDAVKAGIWRGNYIKYPRNMLFARCISNAFAFFTADAAMMRTYHEGEITSAPDDKPPVVPAVAAATSQQIEAAVAEEEEVIDASGVETVEDEKKPGETDNDAMNRMVQEEENAWDPATEPVPDPVTPPGEPVVTESDNEPTISPAQIRLAHVKRKEAQLTDDRYHEILVEVTGVRHTDRIPKRFFSTLLDRLNAEIAAGGTE